jgi:hypothetical protein
MTDIQVAAGLEKAKAKKDEAQQPDAISYDEAVTEGKQLAARLKDHDEWVVVTELELGQLADGVKTEYRKVRLADFAEEIGIKAARLNRCRSVYRAYKDKDFKGVPPKFALLQSVQGHPDRYRIVEDPNMTESKGREIMRLYRAAQAARKQTKTQTSAPDDREPEPDQTQTSAPDDREPEPDQTQTSAPDEPALVIKARRWFVQAQKHALVIVEYGFPVQDHLDPATLRQALDTLDNNPEQTIAAFRKCAEVADAWADAVERGLRPPPTLMLPAPGEASAPPNEPPDEPASDQSTQP